MGRGRRRWSRRRLLKIVEKDTPSAAKPGGADDQLQFNDNGSLGAVTVLSNRRS